MKEPVDHILRPQLPWRTDSGVTECGYDASKVRALTRDEFFHRVKDLGQQRAAMLTCMTCSNTARRWGTWAEDARKALEREIEWECRGMGYYFSEHGCYTREARATRLLDELHAAAALIEAHRDEFDAHIATAGQRRDWLEKKEEAAARARNKHAAKPGLIR